MSKAILTIGISGSGKSTYAESLCRMDHSWLNVNRDDLRFSLRGARVWDDYKFDHRIEEMITQLQKSMCAIAFKLKRNVIISDTNLNPKTRKMWDEYLTHLGFEVEYAEFSVDLEEAIERDQNRVRCLGADIITAQWQKWENYLNK